MYTCSSHPAPRSRHPEVVWAQRADAILVTIRLSDAKEPAIELLPNKLSFKCALAAPCCCFPISRLVLTLCLHSTPPPRRATSAGVPYSVEFEFFEEVVPEVRLCARRVAELRSR
jgi:hypothetical protein